jgi:hypothetical protein
LRRVAVRHDERLRSQLTADEAATLAALLDKLAAGFARPAGATAVGDRSLRRRRP